MELLELKNRICAEFVGSQKDLNEVLDIIEQDKSIFPFNEYEHLISYLIQKKGLTFEKYIDIRNEYIAENPNLWIFEISAPRGFGEKFAQTYILGKCNDVKLASKKLDADYSGQYDCWLDGIRIEVKASRAVDSGSDEPLYVKALSRQTEKPFLMNFQQLKPQFCDVFVWVAVFRDEIVIWVMSSSEVTAHKDYSIGQHRGNTGNEGQLHVKQDSIQLLDKYELKNGDLGNAIRAAAKRNKT